MSVVKCIELIAESGKSWEDAAQVAVQEASKTLHGIQSIWVKDMQAIVENNRITKYRVNVKLSFVIEEKG